MKTSEAAEKPDILLQAEALFHPEQIQGFQNEVARKIRRLRQYDVSAMDRAVAILMWGRSGSLLLASYFDGHEDLLLLPEDFGQRLYEFYDRHSWMSLREKLMASPAYYPGYSRFFQGTFGIPAARYHAAIQAILEVYGGRPREFLESRRSFFIFAHIAYNLALGRIPATPNPLIVYAQHVIDNAQARCLVEDFPQAKFIHTVRDPISSCDGVFHYHFQWLAEQNIFLPATAFDCLINKDQPHAGMENRTRAIRFEDLHANATAVMRDLSDWLGLRFHPRLVDSTFNGKPYVVERDGVKWSGPRPEQLKRHSWHLSRKDRALLYALLYENFVQWNYRCPAIFAQLTVRWAVFASLVLLPTKMERTGAKTVFTHRFLPSIRQGNLRRAMTSILALGLCRQTIIRMLTAAFFRRCLSRPMLLRVTPATEEVHTGAVSAGYSLAQK